MVLKGTSPIYHPSLARNYIPFSNDLNGNGSYIYYDSSNIEVDLPTNFRYRRINSDYGLKLNEVVFGGIVDEPQYSPKLPASSGIITLSNFKGNDSSIPTIDLYFSGNIQMNTSISSSTGSQGYIDSISLSPSIFVYSSTTNNPLQNKTISITYYCRGEYEDGYQVIGETITVTNNWGSAKVSSNNSNGTLTIKAPTSSITDIIPTIFVNWNTRAKRINAPANRNTYLHVDAGTKINVWKLDTDGKYAVNRTELVAGKSPVGDDEYVVRAIKPSEGQDLYYLVQGSCKDAYGGTFTATLYEIFYQYAYKGHSAGEQTGEFFIVSDVESLGTWTDF